MYMNEKLNDVEIGKRYKLELLLEYADSNGYSIISKTIGFGIPTIQYDKEVIINGIENKSNLYCSQNFQNINIIYAEYIK